MASSAENIHPSRPSIHQRSKSNVLASFMHRRDEPDDAVLPSTDIYTSNMNYQPVVTTRQDVIRIPSFSHPNALEEIQQNQLDSTPRSPTKASTFASMKTKVSKDKNNLDDPEDDGSPTKPKKPKSATNLVGLFSKSKTLKGTQKIDNEDELRSRKDKENRTPPPGSIGTPKKSARPPIYAQFASGALEKNSRSENSNDVFNGRPQNGSRHSNGSSASDMSSGRNVKQRPKSYHAAYTAKQEVGYQGSEHGSGKASPSKSSRGLHLFSSGSGSKSARTSESSQSSELVLDPKDIDKHLEAMLDRRNIPENQRYKMRNLANTIKMEFIRQDWAETQGMANRPSSHDSHSSMTGVNEKIKTKEPSDKVKKSRTRSFTLSRGGGKKSAPSSPTKKSKPEGSIGRHFRTKSTDSVPITGERPSSSSGSGSTSSGGGILSKIKLQQGPVDYVNYLRKVQKPEVVEVGKLHKLRLLLRNETVTWTEEFIRQGGMEEIVGLLHRIMEVEWREEHEDALLHENLLCLKALCTTALALQYLHSIQGKLFPALLRMLFDPEKKGPSEFTTRNIITSVMFTYIKSASAQDRPIRARTMLEHLRDPEPKEEDRPLGFVLEMRRERPYRVWCKEVVGVTKEVFWIFLHHLNVVHLPREKEIELQKMQMRHMQPGVDTDTDSSRQPLTPSDSMGDEEYMRLHFPQERPPVPAAPYVGGVEWDATNYLASHLDLLNAIIACTPGRAGRNALREGLRVSGWERCMGGSMRLCKEKFYPGVHDALRTWVAAAADDGWAVRDVRHGPPPPGEASRTTSPAKKPNHGGFVGGGIKLNNVGSNNNRSDLLLPPPKIDIPRLSLGLDQPPTPTLALVGNGNGGAAKFSGENDDGSGNGDGNRQGSGNYWLS